MSSLGARAACALLATLLLPVVGCTSAVRLPAADAEALAARRAVVFVGAESVELTVTADHIDYHAVIAGGGRLSQGTAFPVTDDGLLLSAAHTFDPPGGIVCVYLHAPDPREARFLPAEVVHLDPVSDLAVLRVATPTPRSFALADAPPAPGATVVSSGTSRGSQRGALRAIVASGTALPRLEFERDGDHGDSGGALIDADGRAVGVIVEGWLGWRRGLPRRFGVATAVDAGWWQRVAPGFAPDPRFVGVAEGTAACRLAGAP